MEVPDSVTIKEEIENDCQEEDSTEDVDMCGIKHETDGEIKNEYETYHQLNKNQQNMNITYSDLAQIHKSTDGAYSCASCDFKSLGEKIYENHLLEHYKREDGNYYCDQCEFKSTYKSSLKYHKRSHNELPAFMCKFCEKGFKQKLTYDEHLLQKHPEMPIGKIMTNRSTKCPFCQFKAIKVLTLKCHILANHKSEKHEFERFQCASCEFSSYYRSDFMRHVKLHENTLQLYDCHKCELKFNRKRLLDYHILKKHRNEDDLMQMVTSKLHLCENCDFKSVTKNAFISHTKKCTSKSPKMPTLYSCPKCETKYARKILLDYHILRDHQKEESLMALVTSKLYVCEDCGFRTVKKNVYDLHLKKCLGPSRKDVDFKVPANNKEDDSYLNSFMDDQFSKIKENIQNVDPYSGVADGDECSNFGEQVANRLRLFDDSTRALLMQRISAMVAEAETKNVQQAELGATDSGQTCCRRCDSKFNQKRWLDYHILKLHQDDPEMMALVTCKVYRCEDCPFKCVKGQDYQTHLKRCSANFEVRENSVKLYTCNRCDTVFSMKFLMDYHILKNHRDDEDMMALVTSKVHGCGNCRFLSVKKQDLVAHLKKCQLTDGADLISKCAEVKIEEK